MKRIKVGVIGLGWFGEIHVDTFKELPFAEVVAISTRRKEYLEKISKKYNIKKTFTDYRDLIEDKDIDMVSITTAVDAHMEIALCAIKARKHVFLEKPMAKSVEECDKILYALRNTDKFFMVGHICRFDTAYALAKEEISSGNIGNIISIYSRRNCTRFLSENTLNTNSALFGTGMHDFDLMLWYTGAKPKTVYAQFMNTKPEFKYDNITWALFTLDDGSFAVMENIWSLINDAPYTIDTQMEIIGTKGIININNSPGNYSVLTKNGLSFPQLTHWPIVHGHRRGYLKEELDYFIKSIINNKEPTIITPIESRDVVYGIKMAEKSAKENRVIEF